MKKASLLLLFVVLFSCAKRGNIEGGKKDTIPPQLRMSFPKNGSTNFNQNEIKLVFNEFVKLKDVNKQLIISPPMNTAPLITPTSASKQFTIKIKDTLQENTTYSFNFGQSIQDNNEGNAYGQFKYIFSTGSFIDSLYLQGTIKDAFNKKTDNFVSVMLYEANEKFTDSTIYKEKPRYVTNTLDSLITFKLENLKAGDYYLVAMKDNNGNNKFDPKSEKIGFYSEKITIPDEAIYELELFKEIAQFKASKPSQASGGRYFVPVVGDKSNIEITINDFENNIPIEITDVSEKDSVQFWMPKIKKDSLQIRIRKNDFDKTFTVQNKDQKLDSLSIKAKKTGSLDFRDDLTFVSTIPIQSFDLSKMSLIKRDSTKIVFKESYNPWKQEFTLHFDKEENEKYTLSLLPDAVKDFYGNVNDSLIFRFATRAYTDYGNLRLELKNAKSYPIILDLTDDKGKVLATQYLEKQEDFVYFNHLVPAIFTIRIIYDENKNKQWDTGSYLEKRQTEEVFYFKNAIDIRANWDWEQTIDLGAD